MKKIYLSLLSMGVTGFMMAQHPQINVSGAEKAYEQLGEAENQVFQNYSFLTPKASGDTIWSEDFDGGLGSWTVGGQNPLWAHSLVGPQGQYSDPNTEVIQSSTASNGFAMFDADVAQPGGPATFSDQIGYLESPVVDLTGYPQVAVLFQQAYRHCCSGDFELKMQISDDGFTSSQTYIVNMPGIGANQFTGTDERYVDVTNFLASANDPSNIQIRFLFDGTGGTSHYFWTIDDVRFIEAFDNNMRMDSREIATGGLSYAAHRVPIHQITPVTFSSEIINAGYATRNNVKLEVEVSANGTPVGTVASPGVTMNSFDTDSLITESWTPPSNVAEYDLLYSITTDETEEYADNTFIEDAFFVTENSWGVDNATLSGSFTNFSTQSGQPVKIGNLMEANANTFIYNVSIYISTSSDNVGQLVGGEVRTYNPSAGEFVYASETDFYAVTNADLGSFVTLSLISPVELSAGEEFLLLAKHLGSGGTTDLGIGMSRSVNDLVYGYNANDGLVMLLNPRAILVRAIVTQDLNDIASTNDIEKQAINVSNGFPNPTKETTKFEFNLENASDVSYTVVDMTGKTMMAANAGMLNAGSHEIVVDGSTYANGVYYFNLRTNEGSVTRKIVVSK